MKLRHLLAVSLSAALVALAGPAWASPYVVSVGGSSLAASHALSATSTSPVLVNLQRPGTAPVGASCAAATFSGTINGGSTPSVIGTAATRTFSGCAIPGGVPSLSTSGVWPLRLVGPATSGTDVIEGRLDGVHVTFSMTGCVFVISGSARVFLHEGTQTLEVAETGFTGSLTYTVTSGCSLVLPPSAAANWTGSFSLASTSGLIAVS